MREEEENLFHFLTPSRHVQRVRGSAFALALREVDLTITHAWCLCDRREHFYRRGHRARYLTYICDCGMRKGDLT